MAFILFVLFLGAFDLDVFLDNFRGQDTALSLSKQVLNTTYTTVWIFTGIEGAVVISGRAKSTATAGKATELSFLFLLVLYVLISILTMGILPRNQLAALPNPAMASLLSHMVGPWGGTLINLGVVISIAGAMFSYTIVTADSAYAPAIHGCFPRFLSKTNARQAPAGALLLTAAIIQVLLIIVYFQSSTYQTLYTLATSAIMIPFVLSALYCLKTSLEDRRSGRNEVTAKTWFISIVGTLYGFWMLFATGLDNVVISAMVFAPGFLFYGCSKWQNKQRLFESPADIIAAAIIVTALVISWM
jgi:arginine:ornithine antiporter/lysine permease